MSYDPTIGAYILFGGVSGTTAYNDTWSFSRGNWTDLTSSLPAAPSPRWYFGMVWDAADQLIVLFGGRDSGQDFNDTWTFNGTAWKHLTLSVAPPRMTTTRMVYDAADAYVLQFGGNSIMAGTPPIYNSTWTFHGGVWTNISSTVSRAPQDPNLLTAGAYDASDGLVVFYGNSSSAANPSCTLTGETWTYKRGTFTDITSSLSTAPPVALGSHMMASDPAMAGIVLYGGWGGGGCGYSQGTWAFSGGSWFDLGLSHNPGGLWDGEMAAKASDDSILLFSGNTAPNTPYESSATWNFSVALVVSARAVPIRGATPLIVNFSANATGLPPFAYTWTFGDGTPPSNTKNVTHRYPLAGSYLAQVVVRDAFGHRASRTIPVLTYNPLVSVASASRTRGEVPLSVQFNSTTSGGAPPMSSVWNFGDGQRQPGPNQTHIYSVTGAFTWTFNVTDAQGQGFNKQGLVTVDPALALTAFTVGPIEGIVPLVVALGLTPQGGRTPYVESWSFGDSSPGATGAAVSHTYASAGTYQGSATLSDADNASLSRTFTVTVANPVQPNGHADPVSGLPPLSVNFTAAPTGGFPSYSVRWSFGDAGSTSPFASTSHTYATAGTYHASVTVTDANGNRATENFTVTVSAPASNPTPASSSPSYVLLGVVAAALVGAAIVAFFLLRRRGGGVNRMAAEPIAPPDADDLPPPT